MRRRTSPGFADSGIIMSDLGGNTKSIKKVYFIENIQNLCGAEGGNLISGFSLFSFPSMNQRSQDKVGSSPATYGAGNPSDGDPRVDHLCSIFDPCYQSLWKDCHCKHLITVCPPVTKQPASCAVSWKPCRTNRRKPLCIIMNNIVVINKVAVKNTPLAQTWNLSKNLHDSIFGRKNFTH